MEKSLIKIEITANESVISAFVGRADVNDGELACVMSSPRENWVGGMTPELKAEAAINRGAWWEDYKLAIYESIIAALSTEIPY